MTSSATSSCPCRSTVAALERLALRYVERFATTRGRLTDYLKRKIRERGWEGEPADPAAIAERFAELGYIDDRAYGEAKASGDGAARVGSAAGGRGAAPGGRRRATMPRRSRRGSRSARSTRRSPLRGGGGSGRSRRSPADRPLREKQIGAMLRARTFADFGAADRDDGAGRGLD